MRLIRITIVALALVAAGCSGSSSSDTSTSSESDEATQAAAVEEAEGDFAGLVDIGGGRQIYMECSGTGSPTAVLESGLRGAADVWSMSSAGEGAPTCFLRSPNSPGSVSMTVRERLSAVRARAAAIRWRSRPRHRTRLRT